MKERDDGSGGPGLPEADPRPADHRRRRAPSKLGEIQPAGWLAEYTAELLNVLHVLGALVELEPAQSALLDRICSGPLIPADELAAGDALRVPAEWRKTLKVRTDRLFGDAE